MMVWVSNPPYISTLDALCSKLSPITPNHEPGLAVGTKLSARSPGEEVQGL